jgi:phage host-nuclease inhibitor protein Gam
MNSIARSTLANVPANASGASPVNKPNTEPIMIANLDPTAGGKTRIKKPLVPTLTSRAAAEEMLNSLAASVNAQRALLAERDAKVLAIQNEYAAGLAVLSDAVNIKTEALHAWAMANPDEFPKGRKSLEMGSGLVGFRTGTPKLALASRAFTWAKVLDLVRAKKWRKFLRVAVEVNKDAILARCGTVEKPLPLQRKLGQLGLKLVQEESFYVEPDLTALETKQTVVA